MNKIPASTKNNISASSRSIRPSSSLDFRTSRINKISKNNETSQRFLSDVNQKDSLIVGSL